MQIQWREEMSIDGGLIDGDHRHLISIMNEFCAASPTEDSRDRLLSILDRLNIYTTIHFRREEQLQRAVHYPYIDAHHHEHGDLLRDLYSIHEGLTASVAAPPAEDASPDDNDPAATPTPPTVDPGAIVEAHRKVAEFLHHWLIDHIIKSDLRMKPFAKRMAPLSQGMQPLRQMRAWVDD